MKVNRLIVGVLAIAFFVFFQASPSFALSQYGTSTYITGSSFVYPEYSDGYITNQLTIGKSANLRSGYSPSNINKAPDGSPYYKTTSTPAYATLGWNFSTDWGISHYESSGDTWVAAGSFDSVYDINLNGSVYQNFYWTYNNLLSGRSAPIAVYHAIIYNGVSDSISQLYNVHS